MIAFSLFYKDFEDPIESVGVGAALTETWENAESAPNRVSRWSSAGISVPGPTLVAFNVIFNYSYIDSQITLGPNTIQTNLDRPLVGQPDHVGNFVLEWSQPELGIQRPAALQLIGEKVAFAGTNGLNDVVEDPRGTIDIAYRQGFELSTFDWMVKLSGENLTEEAREWSQGGELWRAWNPGRKIGISLGVNFL